VRLSALVVFTITSLIPRHHHSRNQTYILAIPPAAA
jgi:hypothetical protein